MEFFRNLSSFSRRCVLIIVLLGFPMIVVEAVQRINYFYCSDLAWHCPKCGHSNWKSAPPYTCGNCGYKVG